MWLSWWSARGEGQHVGGGVERDARRICGRRGERGERRRCELTRSNGTERLIDLDAGRLTRRERAVEADRVLHLIGAVRRNLHHRRSAGDREGLHGQQQAIFKDLNGSDRLSERPPTPRPARRCRRSKSTRFAPAVCDQLIKPVRDQHLSAPESSGRSATHASGRRRVNGLGIPNARADTKGFISTAIGQNTQQQMEKS